MEASAHLLAKAAQCRRLAMAIPTSGDPARLALLAMAEEFEGKASACRQALDIGSDAALDG
jgi:hypothetical protein